METNLKPRQQRLFIELAPQQEGRTREFKQLQNVGGELEELLQFLTDHDVDVCGIQEMTIHERQKCRTRTDCPPRKLDTALLCAQLYVSHQNGRKCSARPTQTMSCDSCGIHSLHCRPVPLPKESSHNQLPNFEVFDDWVWSHRKRPPRTNTTAAMNCVPLPAVTPSPWLS